MTGLLLYLYSNFKTLRLCSVYVTERKDMFKFNKYISRNPAPGYIPKQTLTHIVTVQHQILFGIYLKKNSMVTIHALANGQVNHVRSHCDYVLKDLEQKKVSQFNFAQSQILLAISAFINDIGQQMSHIYHNYHIWASVAHASMASRYCTKI